MSRRCPACGFSNDDSRMFCGSCGEPLDAHVRLIQDLEKQKKKQNTAKVEPTPRQKDDDDDYVPSTTQKKGGCYVATAVYGSYDCPQVWTLRRFRDGQLASTLPGRAFIRLYYAVSPTLVRWFGETAWFRKLWKAPLDRLVRHLRAQGVEDSPYEDQVW